MNSRRILFSPEDLKTFREASGDRNPLHLDEKYASKTAYGQRVVYGALGAIACLGDLELPPGEKISRITADFHRPMFLHVDYRAEKSSLAGIQTVRLFDGTVLVVTLAIAHQQTMDGQRLPLLSRTGLFERSEPRELSWNNVQAGLEFTGRYAADSGNLQELCRRWNVTVNPFVVEALLWCSYFVGMEFPGRNALFFRLSLDLSQDSISHQGAIHYLGAISSLHKAVEQVKIRVVLHSDKSQLASGALIAFIRPDLESFDLQHLLSKNSPIDSLAGKVALIIGASRGLGAALAALMAWEGAHVVAVSRSPLELNAALPDHVKQRITWEPGDSADVDSVIALRAKIVERFGRLDFLVCNAFPPIPALRLEVNALGRIQAYIKQSTDLVLVPLCSFLPLLNEHRGCAVIVSSSALEKPVREWPHYLAAKSAIESFGVVAALQYPNISALIVRPERLLTGMTNTPMGRQNALPPIVFAQRITQKLQVPPPPGTAEIFHGNEGELAHR